ncbi:hypothetical protein [Streptomyces sp. AK02-01A]|uniref:hypothetical protein n=1 Tax=Streptomyces sp. AK02-01A TaxID=3028648 RepID=UPI0029A5830E|nr:hypothetical protein [Streptomyces sp. AK02-01A]MDX3853249.1 hypothetical protein [Streptomyces sp. AK02-01A]
MRDSAPASRVSRAFWCEQVTYTSMDADAIAVVSRYSAASPAEAVRSVRVAVRALAFALPPIERHRALSWAEGGGCVGAIAALHRGEPCGFSLSRRTDWIEWSVRPFLVFDVNDKALLSVLPASSGETLACAADSPSGRDVSRS